MQLLSLRRRYLDCRQSGVGAGSQSRFETTPPFALVLPNGAAQPGQYWQRDYAITIEPPAGTGEKYLAEQRYTCKEIKAAGAVLELTTTLKTKPEAVADQLER